MSSLIKTKLVLILSAGSKNSERPRFKWNHPDSAKEKFQPMCANEAVNPGCPSKKLINRLIKSVRI